MFLLRLRRKPQNAVRTPQKDDLKTTQISSGEPLEIAAGAENLEAETVEVCIDKIISNAERRRKE